MCLFCAEFAKDNMKPREVVRALGELDQTDPHIKVIEKMIADRGVEYVDSLTKALEEEIYDELRKL